MAELKITDLVDQSQIDKLAELAAVIDGCKIKYLDAARELAKGLKIEVECKGDLDKLNTVIASSSKKATEAGNELNAALKKQHELSEKVAESLDRMAKSGSLSAKEAKTIADASKKNADALEKEAKAEAALEKARKAGNASRKATVLTEEERIRKVKEALALADREVHSISEANAANKELREAVKVLKDTDDDYYRTLGKLNSAIGVNIDYIKRNSDRYTQQKMTIGSYREEIKQAYYELTRGNKSMKNMGIIAGNTAKILGGEFSIGAHKAGLSIGSMVKGIVGANLLMEGGRKLFSLLKNGVNVAMDFEEANSRLAAILGTTADKTKALQIQARELGASTKYTAAEATDLQIELAKLGFTADEIQNSTKYVLRFAQATGAELPEAAALAGAALRMFNADTTETERYVSAMAVSTTKSAMSFSYLSTALPIVGPVAKSFNFTIEDTLALLGKLSDSGFDASMAATATRNILLNLADSGGKLATALGKPVRTLPELVEGLQKLKNEGVDLNTTLELTDKRSVSAFNSFLTSADKIMILREQVSGVEEELSNMAETMTNNTAGAIKTMESAWEELMISIYGNTGMIKSVISFMTDGIKDLTLWLESAQTTAEKIANRGKTVSATDEDFQRDVDAINKKKAIKIQAGKDEAKAEKEAREEQIELLERTLGQELDLLAKAGRDYKNASINAVDGETKAIRENAKSVLNTLAGEYSALQGSANILEARLKKLKGTPETVSGGGGGGTPDKTSDKEAQYRLKIQQQLEDARIDLMEDGLEKERALIASEYSRKMAQITGNSQNENALRIALGEQMQRDLLKVEEDFNEKVKEEREKAASDKIAQIAEETANEQALLTRQYEMELIALEKRKALGEINGMDYEKERYAITVKYARESANAVIASLEEQLNVENLTAEERERIAKELADKKAELAKKESEEEIKLIKKVKDEDKKASEERKQNLQEWLQVASDAVGTVNDFVNALYENQLNKLDKESEANQEAHDAEIERIEHLVETGAISEEEAEARKRAAEDKTAQKEEEIEKKKQQIAYKQAIWNKASQLAQTGIATALGVMQALAMFPPNIPLAATVAAIGAVQAATIIATPIPKYAKGTEDHPGGLAVVGDGGRSEAVFTKDGVWFTPSVPTLVNLPEHAIVYPDANDIPSYDADFTSPFILRGGSAYSEPASTTVINDYSKLERKVETTNLLIAQGLRDARKRDSERNLHEFMRRRL